MVATFECSRYAGVTGDASKRRLGGLLEKKWMIKLRHTFNYTHLILTCVKQRTAYIHTLNDKGESTSSTKVEHHGGIDSPPRFLPDSQVLVISRNDSVCFITIDPAGNVQQPGDSLDHDSPVEHILTNQEGNTLFTISEKNVLRIFKKTVDHAQSTTSDLSDLSLGADDSQQQGDRIKCTFIQEMKDLAISNSGI